MMKGDLLRGARRWPWLHVLLGMFRLAGDLGLGMDSDEEEGLYRRKLTVGQACGVIDGIDFQNQERQERS